MKTKSRRQAREAVLQALYTMDVGRARLADTIKQTVEQAGLSGEQADFVKSLISGVFEYQTALDEALTPLIADWDYERIAPIDRNILRLAAFELVHCPDIPPLSTINEAIELAKKFSTLESGKFVNGVLAKLLPQTPKADWDPSAHPAYERPTVEDAEAEVEPEPEEAPEAATAVGLWKVRSEDGGESAEDLPEEPR